MSHYKLTYYDFTGLAEPIRCIFDLAGVEFEDVRIPMTPENHPTLPKQMKEDLPWGTLPTLEVDGRVIGQSVAICRFLANRFNLCGADEFDKAKCDELVDGLFDFGKEWRSMVLETDEKKRAGLEKKMSQVTIPFYMGKFEKVAKGNGKWFVGTGVTWADIFIAHLLTLFMRKSQVLRLDEYPSLKQCVMDVLALPTKMRKS